MLSVAISATLTTTAIAATSVATTATHSVESSLTHATIHLLKDVLTFLNELLEFVLELHHLLIHNL
jgi:hypothetical protein